MAKGYKIFTYEMSEIIQIVHDFLHDLANRRKGRVIRLKVSTIRIFLLKEKVSILDNSIEKIELSESEIYDALLAIGVDLERWHLGESFSFDEDAQVVSFRIENTMRN